MGEGTGMVTTHYIAIGMALVLCAAIKDESRRIEKNKQAGRKIYEQTEQCSGCRVESVMAKDDCVAVKWISDAGGSGVVIYQLRRGKVVRSWISH